MTDLLMHDTNHHPQALLTTHGRVRPEWIDYNGHMNVAWYVLVFDHATDALLARLGMDPAYVRREQLSTFALEMHVTYERELILDAPYAVHTQILDADTKRIHLHHQMHHAEEQWRAAGNEVMLMHVDMRERRATPFPPDIQARVTAMQETHARLPRPDGVGRVIGIRR